MASESRFRKRVCTALKGLNAHPVENGLIVGYPDVTWTHGVIELKQRPSWPSRDRTLVKVEKFSPAQRKFLKRNIECGGYAHFLLQVGRGRWVEWVLLDGAVAAEIMDKATRDQIYSAAQLVARHDHEQVLKEHFESLPRS